jgi:hypothetical protein
MFQEEIGELTSEHFRTHIEDYLDTIETSFTGTNILKLTVPTVSDKTLVGGVMQVKIEDLPVLGVDCMDKTELPSNESLCYYQYDGALAGVVKGSDASIADRLAKRYQKAVEKFVKEHQYLHLQTNSNFMMREFLYTGTTFSGSMEVELEDEQPIWVAGFTTNVLWFTSEDYYRQH